MASRHLPILLALIVVAVSAGPARASGIIFETGTPSFIYNGDDSGTQITVTDDGSRLTFHDTGGISWDFDAAPDCMVVDLTTVSCDASQGDEGVGISGLGGNDTIDASGVGDQHDVVIDGGAGTDTIIGHAGNDYVTAVDNSTVDSIDCRGGFDDHATVDANDTVTNCVSVAFDSPLTEMSLGSATEGGGISLTVQLNAAAKQDFTIDYVITNVTTSDDDFAPGATTGTISFKAGDSSKTISIPTNDDSALEPDETFKLDLTNPNPSTAVRLTNSTATATIYDNDALPTVSVSGPASVAEGASATYTVSLNKPSASTVSVPYTANAMGTGPGDLTFPAADSALTFAPGDTSKTVTIQTTQDTVDEDDEGFEFALGQPTGANLGQPNALPTAILDDDPITATLGIGDATAVEGGLVTFTVTRTGDAERNVAATWTTTDGTATSPGDYTGGHGFVQFNPGEHTATITVPTIDDPLDEDAENFTVTLSDLSVGVLPAGLTGTATITDNDAVPKVSVSDERVTEGGLASFRVTLSKASARTHSVGYTTADGSAVSPDDYTPAIGTVTFAPGETEHVVTVQTIQNQAYAPDKTFSLKLGLPVGLDIADGTGEATLVNDDAAPVQQPAVPSQSADLAQSSDSSQPDVLSRLQPAITFSFRPARDRKAPFRYVITGHLWLPAGMAPSVCRAHEPVTLGVVRAASYRLVALRHAKLASSCSFRLRLSLTRRQRGRLLAAVAYAGDAGLLPAGAKPEPLRAG